MSAKFSKEDVIQNKKQAIKDLNHMLEGFINDPTGQRLKKANLKEILPTNVVILSN